jgi:hypothetical protein
MESASGKEMAVQQGESHLPGHQMAQYQGLLSSPGHSHTFKRG